MRTTYTGARPFRSVDGVSLYQYMDIMFDQHEMVPRGHTAEQIENGWGTLHDRYENSTGNYFVYRRELKINTMAIGFRDVVSMDEARGLETGHITVTKNDFIISRLTLESVEQLVNLREVFGWTIIGVFDTNGIGDSREVIIIKFEDTPVVYPHEKVLGRVQRVLAL